MFPKIPVKYAFLAVFLSLILVVLGLFFIYTQFNFMFFEDIVINLDNSKEVLLFSNDSVSVSFDSRVTPNFLCSSVCSYKFVSVSSDEVLFTENFSVRGTYGISFDYVFDSDFNIEGEEYFNFVVSCNNLESFVCNARSEPRIRSKFVVLRKVFDQDKRDFVDSLKVSLNDFIERVYFSRDFVESVNSFNLRFNQFFPLFDYTKYFDLANNIRYEWRSYNYDYLSNFYFDDFFGFERSVLSLKEDVFDFVLDYNERVSFFNNFNYSRLDLYFSLSNFTSDFDDLLGFESLLNQSFKDLTLNYSLVNISFINHSFNSLTPNLDDFKVYLDTAFLIETGEVYESSLESFCDDKDFILSKNASFDGRDELLARGSIYNEYNITFFNEKISLKLEEFNLSLSDAVNYSSDLPLIPLEFFDVLKKFDCIDYSTSRFSGDFLDFNVSKSSFEVLESNPALCCAYGHCSVCSSNVSNPLVLIHGYSFGRANTPEYSTDIFNNMIKYLKNKNLYVDGGIVGPDTISFESSSPVPLVFRATYYFVTIFDELGYVTSVSKSENIDTYAIRLNSIINDVLDATGAEKVDVVAHSMGGLVFRRYLQVFGEERIDRVVLVGTPNSGISSSVRRFCGLFGFNTECEDMSKGSTFLNVLNDPRSNPSINITNIVGVGCSMREGDGDGVVLGRSSELEFATNHFIEGDCRNNPSFHSALLYPGHHREVFDIILGVLELN
ncbi:MAG: esterase/lipase family protein [Candidatus Woesearchaeota archaeon]